MLRAREEDLHFLFVLLSTTLILLLMISSWRRRGASLDFESVQEVMGHTSCHHTSHDKLHIMSEIKF